MSKTLITISLLVGAAIGWLFVYWPTERAPGKNIVVDNGLCETNGLYESSFQNYGRPLTSKVVYNSPCADGPDRFSKKNAALDFILGILIVSWINILLYKVYKREPLLKRKA